MPSNEPRVTKAQRRDDARIKAQQMRQEQQRKERRNRMLAIGGLVLAVHQENLLHLILHAFGIFNQEILSGMGRETADRRHFGRSRPTPSVRWLRDWRKVFGHTSPS